MNLSPETIFAASVLAAALCGLLTFLIWREIKRLERAREEPSFVQGNDPGDENDH